MLKKTNIQNFNAIIKSISGTITIRLCQDNAKLTMEENTKGSFSFQLANKNSNVYIGKNTSAVDLKVFCNNSEFICGEDCMFSSGVTIQTSDQHGIVDISQGKIINNNFRSVVLGDHVWIARDCTLMSGANVGEGSIIGARSVVTNNIGDKVLAVGSPAKVIKENYTWSRSSSKLDDFSRSYIKENNKI